MTERTLIWVWDGGAGPTGRVRKLEQIERYLYSGSEYKGWGTCRCSTPGCTSRPGFFFEVPEEPGFGPAKLLHRMVPDHTGHVVGDPVRGFLEEGPGDPMLPYADPYVSPYPPGAEPRSGDSIVAEPREYPDYPEKWLTDWRRRD